jgi:hypothetical protein
MLPFMFSHASSKEEESFAAFHASSMSLSMNGPSPAPQNAAARLL